MGEERRFGVGGEPEHQSGRGCWAGDQLPKPGDDGPWETGPGHGEVVVVGSGQQQAVATTVLHADPAPQPSTAGDRLRIGGQVCSRTKMSAGNHTRRQ